MKKIIFLVSVIIFLAVSIIIYDKLRIKEYEKDMFYMDTYIYVKIYEQDSKLANKALNKIEKIYKEYHELTDKYKKYDNLNNLYVINNNVLKDEYLTLDPRLIKLIKYGIRLYDMSNGKIDISMGNVIDIWNSYRSGGIGIPSIEELEYANFNNIEEIEIKNNKIKNNNLNLDLGCIAKGYTTNEVKKYLDSVGIDKYIINAGGNVIVGKRYHNELYKVGLEDANNSSNIYKVLSLENKAIVTSGGYDRFYTYDGKTYTHIIDPNTLYPVDYMKSVTVITDDSAYGDFLSTYLFLMDVDSGIDYVNKLDNVEAIWYLNDNTTKTSNGFKIYE